MLLSAHAASRPAQARRVTVQRPLCPSTGVRTVIFTKVISSSSFKAADGTEVRLAGVLGAGDGGESLSPSQADAARAALASALRAGPLTLADIGTRDRYGRIPAEVFANGIWVQSALLRAGHLRVAPDHAGAPCAKLLLEAEAEARDRQAGHWADGIFALRMPEQIRNSAGHFEILEGTVRQAYLTKGRATIDFRGSTDFKATISTADMKGFREVRFNLRRLTGQRVRLRGWMVSDDGLEMEVATPAAIEFVDCRRGAPGRC